MNIFNEKQLLNMALDAKKTNYLTHGLHPYPAKFIPQIPRKAILEWTKEGDTILDPFCGCGTTILEAALLNRLSIGVDNGVLALCFFVILLIRITWSVGGPVRFLCLVTLVFMLSYDVSAYPFIYLTFGLMPFIAEKHYVLRS